MRRRAGRSTLRFQPQFFMATVPVLERWPAEEIVAYVGRHARGDWGEVAWEDRSLFDARLKEGGALYSCFQDRFGEIWLRTDEERRVTLLYTVEPLP